MNRFFLIYVLLSLKVFSQDLSFSNNKILWDNSIKLSWDDFKGIAPLNEEVRMAQTSGEISCSSIIGVNGIPIYEIKCFFLKETSWVISKEPELLNHEQLHFDIYELYARKIRRSLDSLNGSGVIDKAIYDTVIKKWIRECENYNDRYDDESVHGIILAIQEVWDRRIEKELFDLKAYQYTIM